MTLQTCAPENFHLWRWGDERTRQVCTVGERGPSSAREENFPLFNSQFVSKEKRPHLQGIYSTVYFTLSSMNIQNTKTTIILDKNDEMTKLIEVLDILK